MRKTKYYIEHSSKVVEDERFEHVMAISLNPLTGYNNGVIRCITSRMGDVRIKGYVDRSKLFMVERKTPECFEITEQLVIKKEKEIVKKYIGKDWDFIGLEDPDIWIDEKTGLMHMYFTIPLKGKKNRRTLINLGHAVGRDLNSLEMSEPVLVSKKKGVDGGAKELFVAPLNKQGFRYNLVESSVLEDDFRYSVVRVAVARDMGKQWEYGEVVFHPKKHNLPWIAGHASPGPLLSRTFIDVGRGKRLGILNGREANQRINNKIKYGMFSVGLFIYDYEKGKIEWVSPEALIKDSQAKTITFASQFIETDKGVGILYAHVDDSFVRAYTLNANAIKSLLP